MKAQKNYNIARIQSRVYVTRMMTQFIFNKNERIARKLVYMSQEWWCHKNIGKMLFHKNVEIFFYMLLSQEWNTHKKIMTNFVTRMLLIKLFSQDWIHHKNILKRDCWQDNLRKWPTRMLISQEYKVHFDSQEWWQDLIFNFCITRMTWLQE